MCSIKTYYGELENTYDSGNFYIYNNSDRAHNAAIMLLMLSKSKEIHIFCGSMSVFRDSFYEKIGEDNPENAEFLKNAIKQAWSEFISKKDSKITIILEDRVNLGNLDLIIPKEDFEKKNVSLNYLPDNVDYKADFSHFSYVEDDKIVRVELDKDSHEALCSIGVHQNLPPARQIFEKLLKLACKIA